MYIHNIRDMKVLHTIRDTPPNPHGLCALSINNDNCFLAYPGSNLIGEVQIFDTINLVSYSRHSKIDKTKVLKTNGRVMKVKSIAKCSKRAFCNTFDLHYAIFV